MATVAQTKVRGKGHYSDKLFYYLNVLDIETEKEWNRLFKKIKKVVEDDD